MTNDQPVYELTITNETLHGLLSDDKTSYSPVLIDKTKTDLL